MKEILKNKLFIICLLFFSFILILNINSFASFEVSISDDLTEKIILPDFINDYNYACVSTAVSGNSSGNLRVQIALCNSPLYYNYSFSGNSPDFYYSYFSDESFYYHEFRLYRGNSTYDLSNTTLSDFNLITTIDQSGFTNYTTGSGLSNDKALSCSGVIYANNNIYRLDNSSGITNELVFQGAPQAQGEAVQVELMKPTQVQEIPQQIVAIVMIVLPIFLGIFGVLLVLYLIKSKNLLQL